MLGTGLQFGRGGVQGEDRFYNPVKARRNQHHYPHPQNHNQLSRTNKNNNNNNGSSGPPVVSNKGKSVILDNIEPENRAGKAEENVQKTVPAALTVNNNNDNNLDRFLESTTPSVPAQYLSTTRMRGLRTCDVEYQPYFMLADLWESFKEWSAYGAGVPLILNDSDSVVQYYVPYLSGIQIYGDSMKSPKLRRPGEESDGDYSRDSSSDGSSDYELETRSKYLREQWNRPHLALPVMMAKPGILKVACCLSFLNGILHTVGEPLADKAMYFLSQILDLARRFPQLKTLRSCDLLSSSWISVAWYPIYRIPTGPTLKDLDACFLTFHTLSTPMTGAGNAQGPVMTYPDGMDGVHKISLPVFGLASYKLKGSMWTPSGGSERQLSNSLLQAADKWLRLLQVNHPDFQFFASHGTVPM
ncbi:hypothetical protein IFM89_024460 [Coptis chinensis]|uniref:Uncharacterized protein n=1 Tax=Coptis chinensis TaxID=261450 RepID=A0A835H8P3_9MAGN|nr:hypothetical protein IFM89_024460 [Coptis chinensis]